MAKPKYTTPNSILAAARECGLGRSSLRQVAGARALRLLDSVFESFTVGGTANREAIWLWNELREPSFSVTSPRVLDALLALGPADTPIWLMVEDWARQKRGPAFWIFETTLGEAITTLNNHH